MTQLFWKPTADYSFENVLNWFLDAAATTPASASPVAGDRCDYASGVAPQECQQESQPAFDGMWIGINIRTYASCTLGNTTLANCYFAVQDGTATLDGPVYAASSPPITPSYPPTTYVATVADGGPEVWGDETNGTLGPGIYDPLASAVFPAAADTLATAGSYGPTGVEYVGSYNGAANTIGPFPVAGLKSIGPCPVDSVGNNIGPGRVS